MTGPFVLRFNKWMIRFIGFFRTFWFGESQIEYGDYGQMFYGRLKGGFNLSADTFSHETQKPQNDRKHLRIESNTIRN